MGVNQLSKGSINYWEQNLKTLANQLQSFQSLTSKLSTQTNEMDQWLQILGHFSTALHDKEKRKKMVSSLAKIDQEAKKSSVPAKGDLMYDLFNSPNMLPIVKETLQRRKKG